jgi:hypothetical protein
MCEHDSPIGLSPLATRASDASRQYFAKMRFGQSNTQRGGQFAPLLSIEEWKTLFRQLDAGFYELDERIRVRAYELYEQRGKRDGHALDDWLQSEAELTEQKSLRSAA